MPLRCEIDEASTKWMQNAENMKYIDCHDTSQVGRLKLEKAIPRQVKSIA